MKKFLAAITLLALLFIPSCAKVSMKDLLQFQNCDYTAKLTTSDENEQIDVDITKDGNTYTFTVDGKYTFVYNGEKWSISYNGLTLPLSGEALKKSLPQKLLDALTSSQSDGWSITKENAGGISLYVCECATRQVKLFIDADTSLPLKIICGGVEFDVVKFEISSSQ